MVGAALIELAGVTKRYGAATVVDGVSLTIPRGGVTALIGPNGAGKSTLLSIIGRLLPADAGSVQVDGMDVARAPGEAMARRLSILRQENQVALLGRKGIWRIYSGWRFRFTLWAGGRWRLILRWGRRG